MPGRISKSEAPFVVLDASAHHLAANHVDRVVQSCSRREMEKERADTPIGELDLDPRVESVHMDANDMRGPTHIADGERPSIEPQEPPVRGSHLVVECKR